MANGIIKETQSDLFVIIDRDTYTIQYVSRHKKATVLYEPEIIVELLNQLYPDKYFIVFSSDGLPGL